MTKEERVDILKQLIQKHTGCQWHTAEKAAYHLYDAEQEYAKQEAIGFWQWVGGCDFTFQRAGIHIFIENNPHGIKSGYYTVDQLYNLYQQQKEGK